MSHLYAVSQGDLTGWEHITKFGMNPAIAPATTPETIWEFGGNYNWITSAVPLEVLSSSASDAFAGIGAKQVKITGLDASWNRQTETINMNGVTPVVTTLPWWRINNFQVIGAGTSLTNVGNITLRSTGGGLTRDYIAAGAGLARTMVFSVPANYDMLINLIALSPVSAGNGVPTAIVESRIKNNTAAFGAYVYRPAQLKVVDQQFPPYHHFADPPVFYGEKTDYSWEIIAVSGSAMGVGFYFSASLVNKTLADGFNTAEHPRW